MIEPIHCAVRAGTFAYSLSDPLPLNVMIQDSAINTQVFENSQNRYQISSAVR